MGRKGPGHTPLLLLRQRMTDVKGTYKTLHLHVVHLHLNRVSRPIIQPTIMASLQVGGGAAEEASAGVL